MRVLFISNYPSPYRVDFWNLLGKQVDLTVVFTSIPQEQQHRSEKWFNNDYSGFKALFLKRKVKICGQYICADIFGVLKDKYDYIVLGGYSSGTQMAVIEYLRFRRIPFVLEADGGLIQKESFIRRLIKRHFISAASTWMSSGEPTTDYFVYYGADANKIFTYTFTSQWKADIDDAALLIRNNKKLLRRKLGMTEDNIVISVGRFSYKEGFGKGYDTLCSVATMLKENIGIYIIGDEPTEYFKELKEKCHLKNVHYIGFKGKNELKDFYAAADIFVLLTRNDVWGLVINEAMSFGLPIITTSKCGAGLALINNGINGYIVPPDNPESVKQKIELLFSNTKIVKTMSYENLKKIQKYTIENMVESHMQVFRRSVEV